MEPDELMGDLIVEIVEIEDVKAHPNADKMDLAIIKGWQLCVNKNGYKIGDKGVYFPIDVLVPKDVAIALDFDKYLSFTKLEPNFGRVRAIRLRNEMSYGVFVPLNVVTNYLQIRDNTNFVTHVGMDMVKILGIKKWEEPLKLNSQDMERDHPLFTRYTKIGNLRNFPNVFTSEDDVVVTEKIHGTNARFGLIDGEFMVGSHDIRLKESETNKYWYVFNNNPNIKELLITLQKETKSNAVILYGEIYGPGIQKGYTYGVPQGKLGFRCFDIKLDETYMDYVQFYLFTSLEEHPVEVVPVIYQGKFDLQLILDKFSKSKTTFEGQTNIMEGVVIKPRIEEFYGCYKRKVLKYVFDQYLDPKNKTTEYH